MPQTAAQIVTNALQIAKCRGFTAQGGQMLNSVLAELCQDYDFDACKKVANFLFGSTGVAPAPDFNSDFNLDFSTVFYGAPAVAGPYLLPADWLRAVHNDVTYSIDGLPHVMVNLDNAQYDALLQQQGTQSYPEYYTVVSLGQGVPPAMYVWPPPSGAFPVSLRYYRQMPDITTPETSTAVPWFPNQNYLLTRLAGEMMKFTDDERCETFLGDGPGGAQGVLKRYLKLKDDGEDRVTVVSLDRRRFMGRWDSLKSTKAVGFP